MRVKHLIRELQKCDPEKEVRVQSDDGRFLATYELVIRRGEVHIGVTEEWSNWFNDHDTPYPLPERPLL